MGQDKARGGALLQSDIRPLVTRGQIWSISAATGLFLAVALGLVLIVSHVVVSMRHTANDIDDQRAISAAAAAVAALERGLSIVVRDNSLWDEGYEAVRSGDGAEWIRETWGDPTVNYPLYDGLVVFRPDLTVIAAYDKGEPFTPSGEIGELIAGQAKRAQASHMPVTAFMSMGGEIVSTAAMTIQPFAGPVPDAPVLFLFKSIDDEIIASMASDYQISGLALAPTRADDKLNLALDDPNGAPLGYLTWPSRKPGDLAFESHRSLLVMAGATLVVFLLMVLAAGFVESLRLRRIAAAAEYEAKRDTLTGTLNRSGFLEVLDRLAAEASSSRPVTLHMLDLDGFKQVNDTWGHAVGDLLIVAVAVRLAGFGDHFVAVGRLGGDEFALAQVHDAPPEVLAQQVIDAFSKSFMVGRHDLHVTTSIGYASTREPIDPAELMRRADVAMYRAKAEGKFRALEYHSKMEESCKDQEA
ncbi:diguanylate cyclase domain-containing protein [Stappia indica]|uniref:diguanylate cyclase domain-containing protein n=1 Tax=Stappia indica TaxID=538381 RepID=UPI000BE23DB0|nr:diguanylate cyclase [Stappia indica]MCC4246920.1 diguanylate cyclase [Stappia indica]